MGAWAQGGYAGEGADIRMTLADLDKLIRLESFLSDEPESRHGVVLNDLKGRSDSELQEMVRHEVETLRQIKSGGS